MQVKKQQFFILWVLCILGSLAILPYVRYMGILSAEIPIWKTILLSASQGALLFGLICWISFKVVPKTDLCPFPALSNVEWLKKVIYPASISGAIAGLAIVAFDQTIFYSSILSGASAPIWASALASLYGAINEEVSLRLFLFTTLYFLVSKCVQKRKVAVLWGVNICVALLFGIGHLPAAFKLASPSTFEIIRILFLNGIGGIVFGWLYWSRGLWAAIVAHFVADLVIHVLL
jgi:hypothetical protein